MKPRIYHNPRCSKSRETLTLLQDRGIDVDVIEYLRTPLDATALNALLAKLRLTPREIVRSGEDAFKQSGIDLATADEAALVELIAEQPKIMQRPIVETDSDARIGRPPEQVLDLFK